MSEFYLYRHIRPDLNVPFYIGIGKKRNRPYISISAEYERAFFCTKSGRSKYWTSVFNKCNKNIEVDILYESSSEDEIKIKEKEFISLYKKTAEKGTLVNLTDGGEGTWGLKISPEHRLKISESVSKARKGIKFSNEHKLKLSQAKIGNKINLGHKHTDDAKKRMSISQKNKDRNGYKHSDETKAKIGLKAIGRIKSEETRRKISIGNKGKKNPHTEETKRKISIAHIGKKHSDETLLKMSIAGKQRIHKKHTEESKIKMSEVRKALAKERPITDELRLKLSLAHKGKNASPETKIKMSLQRKGITTSLKGRKLSEETKAKKALSMKINKMLKNNEPPH